MKPCRRPHLQRLNDFGTRTVRSDNYMPIRTFPGSEIEAIARAQDSAHVVTSQTVIAQEHQQEKRDTIAMPVAANSSNVIPPTVDREFQPQGNANRVGARSLDDDESCAEIFDIHTNSYWGVRSVLRRFHDHSGLEWVTIDWQDQLILLSEIMKEPTSGRRYVQLQTRKFWCRTIQEPQWVQNQQAVRVVWEPTDEPSEHLNTSEEGSPERRLSFAGAFPDVMQSIEDEPCSPISIEDNSDDDLQIIGVGTNRPDRRPTSCWLQNQANQRIGGRFRQNSLDRKLKIQATEAGRDHHLVDLVESSMDRLDRECRKECRSGRRPEKHQPKMDLKPVLSLPKQRVVYFSEYAICTRRVWDGTRSSVALATAVQAVGQVRSPCSRCRRGNRAMFPECVTASVAGRAIMQGSCACCYYRDIVDCDHRKALQNASMPTETDSNRGTLHLEAHVMQYDSDISTELPKDSQVMRKRKSEDAPDIDECARRPRSLRKRKAQAIEPDPERAYQSPPQSSPEAAPAATWSIRTAGNMVSTAESVQGFHRSPPSSPRHIYLEKLVTPSPAPIFGREADVTNAIGLAEAILGGLDDGGTRQQLLTRSVSAHPTLDLGVFAFASDQRAAVHDSDFHRIEDLTNGHLKEVFACCGSQDALFLKLLNTEYQEYVHKRGLDRPCLEPGSFLRQNVQARQVLSFLIRNNCPSQEPRAGLR